MADKKSIKLMVQSAELRATKGGKSYMRLKLFEAGGRALPGMMWESRDDLKPGVVIDALVEDSEYNGEQQYTVHAARVLPGEAAADDFLPKSPYDIENMYLELGTFIKSVKNEKLVELLLKAYQDPRWKRTPAATTIHHAYLAGLLEHAVNLCRLSDAVAKLYPKVKRDLLITASVLHDCGKMDEILSGINLEYSIQGELIGHVTLGLLRVDRWMEEMEFDDELRMIVRHMILSHHGNTQYGSPKSPATFEAQIFSKLDGVDAEIGAMTAVIAKAGPDQIWSPKVKWETRYYLGETK